HHRIAAGRPRGSSAPLHGEGPGARRRPWEGRRYPTRRDLGGSTRGRGPAPRHGHPRVPREAGVPGGAPPNQEGTLPGPHNRPPRNGAAPDGDRDGRHGRGGGPTGGPPHTAHPRHGRPPAVSGPGTPAESRHGHGQ